MLATNLSISAATALGLISATKATLTPNNLLAASTSGSLTAVRYTHVGGDGSYQQVTDLVPGTFPTCSANPSCVKTTKTVSGNLAPFDEDLTVVMRGPMNVYNIAVYQPDNTTSATWKRTSSWASGNAAHNLVFMNNNGGGASGEWSICGGASQSYASSDFSSAAASPKQTYGSYISASDEVNIMTATECNGSNCEGFYRGTSNLGWAGSKMFVFEFDMPSDSDSVTPAIWALNGQVVRSAQYGCNCRGEGGEGGCGEIDLVENLVDADHNQGISEIYSFKGATGTGTGNYFARPTTEKAVFGVIFDVKTDQITIQKWSSWDFTQKAVTRSIIDGYLSTTAKVISFSTNARKRREHRVPTFLAGRRRH
ncbi:hypothetical protein PUNSTDRAFT_52080 [Punctularia strigosozonata HHB-11173 SS5]|uniref:uncharacterized protein n=1 Tax=Punctularia strigosozonata (strain HHB-11173) TaxID=741275 RepID=UPI0004416550|nr:uncharacterized protein PUNSTDRAFT_52080 [Punctularia strigosozonata HHB-11173 SS5]EIN09943.1 hypothetical protein PUNSTDRAFT_52080 [Punctularia strigosozonata HHB-11173 SS5]